MCAVKINRIGKFDLNPRGNLWVKDESRFGHKLMSKMGWSQGKGLGKNEDGIKENLKVKVKTEHSGIGWTEKFPLAVETAEYDAVLANLNAKFNNSSKNKSNDETTRSIVERSQEFKKRIHYGKFVRGKDVGRYSEKDFNSIFVTKMPKMEPKVVEESTITNVECPSDNSDTMTTYKSSLSMKEYFEMKMKKLKVENVTYSAENMEIDKSGSELKELSSKKNRKRKHESDSEESSNDDFQGFCMKNSETDSKSQEADITMKKSKKSSIKSKKLKKDSDFEEGSSNTSVENNEDFLEVTKSDSIITENDSIDNTVKKRKSKKGSEKSKKLNLGSNLEELSTIYVENDGSLAEASQCENISDSNTNLNTTTNVESSEVNKVKKKKKHKKSKAEVDLSDESTSPDSSANEKEYQNEDAEESVVPEELSGSKKHKKLKVKKSKKSTLLKGLKTCLKTIGTYAVERESGRVSFSEQVRCRMLTTYTDEGETEESKCEINDVVLPCVNKEAISNETKESVVESSESPVKNDGNTQCEDSKEAVEDEDSTPNCMDLPKGDNSNYNSWLENQRIATKMKLYKGMVKKIKKHPVLKTSNLLDLKGYGNWGF